MFILVLTSLIVSFGHSAEIRTNSIKDSYLSAYSEVHGGKLDTVNGAKNDRDFSVQQDVDFHPGYPEGPVYKPDFPYPPPSPPVPQYGPPKPIYGIPQAIYGVAKPEYGPPKHEYGPPSQR